MSPLPAAWPRSWRRKRLRPQRAIGRHAAGGGRQALRQKGGPPSPGKHLLLAYVSTLLGHDKEKSVRFLGPQGFRLVNPLDAHQANPWCFLPLAKFDFAGDDLIRPEYLRENREFTATVTGYVSETNRLLKEVRSPQDFPSRGPQRGLESSSFLSSRNFPTVDSITRIPARRSSGSARGR